MNVTRVPETYQKYIQDISKIDIQARPKPGAARSRAGPCAAPGLGRAWAGPTAAWFVCIYRGYLGYDILHISWIYVDICLIYFWYILNVSLYVKNMDYAYEQFSTSLLL